jgi:hypothetical protein
MAIVPVVTAAQEKGIEASLFYGRATGPLSGVDAAELTREFERQVSIRPILQPRLHAKVLCWDDDALAVSSQIGSRLAPHRQAYEEKLACLSSSTKSQTRSSGVLSTLGHSSPEITLSNR